VTRQALYKADDIIDAAEAGLIEGMCLKRSPFGGPDRVGQFGSGRSVTFFRNTGRRDVSELPILKQSKQYNAEAITQGG